MVDHRQYTYRVTWSEEDQEYVALCAELPGLSFLHEDQTEAFVGILSLVEQVVDDLAGNNESIPVPLSQKKFSGTFQVRTTPERHRQLAIAAAEQGVSMNRLVNDRLVT